MKPFSLALLEALRRRFGAGAVYDYQSAQKTPKKGVSLIASRDSGHFLPEAEA